MSKKKKSKTSKATKVTPERGTSKTKKTVPQKRRGRIALYGKVWAKAEKLTKGRSFSVKPPTGGGWDLSSFRNALAMSLGRKLGHGKYGTSINAKKGTVIVSKK